VTLDWRAGIEYFEASDGNIPDWRFWKMLIGILALHLGRDICNLEIGQWQYSR
jgi:hypothetical protein